jgi:RNA polymerase sigma factor (sigma-70 family)
MPENGSPEIDEETLVLRMMEKDESALVELVKVFGPKVRGYLRIKFGEDLKEPELHQAFNRAFFNAYRFAEKFNPEKGGLRGWLIRIARNAAISIIRAEERHQAKDLEYDPSYDPADDCDDMSPDVDSKEHARLTALYDFINNKLTGFERIVARNCFIAGGEADIGRLVALYGKDRQNVDTVKSKVKKKITQALLDWDSRQGGRKGKP